MKHIALAGWLMASVAAQQPKSPELELANIIAVEEQEHDLDKAQELYEQALASADLSAGARALATQRLAALRKILSHEDVGDAQDSQRERELRAQARELLKGYDGWRVGPQNPDGVPRQVIEQLLWIGEPAVPEVVALLQLEAGKPYGGKAGDFLSLWVFLWQTGGPVAEQFFVDCASNDLLAGIAATTANSMKVVDVDSPAVRAYLDHPNPSVTEQFLVSRGNDGTLIDRLRSDQLVEIAERGSPSVRALVLRRSTSRPFAKDELVRMHALVRAGLAGTDPDVGKAAEQFLVGPASQTSLDGVLLVLENLPELRRRGVYVAPPGSGMRSSHPFESMSAADVERLARAVDTCVTRIGKVDLGDQSGPQWLDPVLYELFRRESDVARSRFLAWWDLGYDMSRFLWGANVVTAQNAGELIERYDRAPSNSRHVLLQSLIGFDLPASSFDLLARIAAENDKQVAQVGQLIAQTGSLEALQWIVERWRVVDPEERGSRVTVSQGTRTTSGGNGPWWEVAAMIELARRNDSEEVRAAMRNMVRGFGGPKPNGDDRSKLLLALMSMGDAAALEYVAASLAMDRATHPFDQDRVYTPMQYLVDQKAEPPHNYTAQQVLETVRAYEQQFGERGWLDPKSFPRASIADEVVVEFASHEESRRKGVDWQEVAMDRLNSRLQQNGDVSVLEPWFLSVIGKSGVATRCANDLRREVVKRYRSQLIAAIDGESEYWARRVVNALWWQDVDGDRPDIVTLLKNRHQAVREDAMALLRDGVAEAAPEHVIPMLRDEVAEVRATAATYLGAKVCKDAVPALIERLRDEAEEVREAASAALTRIRFYHEQQAHWDRVLKGVDASAASAAEKLLMQAKPDQEKAQRLLAIESLGVLGKAEALPFLIEFSQEADADVAKAAKAAITKIHLGGK